MKLRLQCSLAPSCDLQHTTRDQKAKKVTAWLFMGSGGVLDVQMQTGLSGWGAV